MSHGRVRTVRGHPLKIPSQACLHNGLPCRCYGFNPDNFASGKAHAVQLEKEVQNFRLKGLQLDDMMRLKKVSQTMKADAAGLKAAQDLTAMKASFSAVTQSLFTIMETMKCTDEAMYLQYCPMEKGYWLSYDKTIENPYAASMRKCGELVKGMATADYPEPVACH
ncbi:DUF3347 domain-containing protein [Sphingobacterium multivorum]|nr:DUF3347 domain-containing protein [Sphingobacterium multivorum]